GGGMQGGVSRLRRAKKGGAAKCNRHRNRPKAVVVLLRSLPGLTRQSIIFLKIFFPKKMDGSQYRSVIPAMRCSPRASASRTGSFVTRSDKRGHHRRSRLSPSPSTHAATTNSVNSQVR